MTEMGNKKLDLILNELQGIKEEQREIRIEIKEIKADVSILKTEMAEVKVNYVLENIVKLEKEVEEMKNKIA